MRHLTSQYGNIIMIFIITVLIITIVAPIGLFIRTKQKAMVQSYIYPEQNRTTTERWE